MRTQKTYKLNKSSGPVLRVTVYMLMAIGLLTLYFSFSSLILILFGSALSFSYRTFEINTLEGFYRPCIKLLGLVKFGDRRTFPVRGQLRLEHVKPSGSLSGIHNRMIKSDNFAYRIWVDQGRRKMLVARFNSLDEAQREFALLQEILLTDKHL